MKVAICSTGNTKDSKVASRYARCDYFMIYNHETLESEFIENVAKNEGSGAGGKVTKNLADLDVTVVLVPQVGPKAYDALNAFGIEAFEYKPDTTVHNALYEYFEKVYPQVTEAKGKGKH